jgi:hypothetical protein
MKKINLLSKELKLLKPKTRNQLRAIMSLDINDAIEMLNKLRLERPVSELVVIERILKEYRQQYGLSLPDLFPKEPQTTEAFRRLSSIEIEKILLQVTSVFLSSQKIIESFFYRISELTKLIAAMKLVESSELASLIIEEFGYSHFMLRKISLINALNFNKLIIPKIDDLLTRYGVNEKNVIVSSLINCYEYEQDFLTLKRSIMSYPNRGDRNKYTRDILRLPFHPHALDQIDLASMIQSNLQSSLIDALIIIKSNLNVIDLDLDKRLLGMFELIDSLNASIDDIAFLYVDVDDGEDLFYKHSSAWLENPYIVKYRLFNDHFLDSHDANYLNISDKIKEVSAGWGSLTNFEDLAVSLDLTLHRFENLKKLENDGFVTRSSMFNYILNLNEGNVIVKESVFFRIMEKTRDLSKTINPRHLKRLALLNDSSYTKLLCYLLIAKRSRNTSDDHNLRKIIQSMAKEKYNANLTDFINAIAERSEIVASYIYEICTEDFLGLMPHIIKTASSITETRSSLHKWMGNLTGEQGYLDRARTILIDHQINKVRNELDDNRIYVDSARFSEWINDEIMRDMTAVLTSIKHRNISTVDEEVVLIEFIQRCYQTFCSNNIFGIASYLGRRIRHGTFKGHLYHSVVSIEKLERFNSLFKDPTWITKWEHWKREYERKIDDIIVNNLHVESISKRDGLLKTSISNHPMKHEVATLCVKALVKDFMEHSTTQNATVFITEYCWRMLEVDLKNVNAFLKNKRDFLINNTLLTELKQNSRFGAAQLGDFYREVFHLVDDQIKSMYNWFKRPISVSPKASLSLLYKAVVKEVSQTFINCSDDGNSNEADDFELIGGVYHVLYDAFYVVVYNAAKHGKEELGIDRTFSIVNDTNGSKKVLINIISYIKDCESDSYVQEMIAIKPTDDVIGAQAIEGRSGIKKLHHLAAIDPLFSIVDICVGSRKVSITLSYDLDS